MSGPAHRSLVTASLSLACLVGAAELCGASPPGGAVPARAPASGSAADTAEALPPFALRTEWTLDRDALSAAGVRRPTRLAYDAEGALYILDSETRRVVKVDSRGRVLFDVGGYGSDETSLELPIDIAVDRNQSLLVLDRGRGTLLAFDRVGRFLASRSFQGSAADEARGAHARLVLDPFGKLWLLAAQARDLVPLGDHLDPARATRFLSPEDSLGAPLLAAVLSGGESWVYDAARGALLRFGASGRLRFQVALPTIPEPSALSDLATDAGGFVYAADERGQRILVFGPDGALVVSRSLGGSRIRWRPAAIAIGPGGKVAVADAGRDEIQVLSLEREAKP